MSKLFKTGGIVASVILIAFGIASIVMGTTGLSDVHDKISQENITGSDDMNEQDIAAAAEEAGLEGVELPDCDVAGKPVDDGDSAKCFAEHLRIHALEATGGKTYAEMPRFMGKDGEGTNDPAEAAVDPESGAPVNNPERQIWVTATALSTALNTSYFAERVALFSIVMGVALLLTGIGFLVLTLGLVRRAEADATAPRTGPPPAAA